MTDTTWLTDNWPWWLMVFFLVTYEIYALVTKKGRTLSRMIWTSSKQYPWLVPIVLSFLTWLVLHFFVTRGSVAIELTVTGIIVVVIWMAYLAWRKKAQ